MRKGILLLLMVAALAGCIEDDGGDDPADAENSGNADSTAGNEPAGAGDGSTEGDQAAPEPDGTPPTFDPACDISVAVAATASLLCDLARVVFDGCLGGLLLDGAASNVQIDASENGALVESHFVASIDGPTTLLAGSASRVFEISADGAVSIVAACLDSGVVDDIQDLLLDPPCVDCEPCIGPGCDETCLAGDPACDPDACLAVPFDTGVTTVDECVCFDEPCGPPLPPLPEFCTENTEVQMGLLELGSNGPYNFAQCTSTTFFLSIPAEGRLEYDVPGLGFDNHFTVTNPDGFSQDGFEFSLQSIQVEPGMHEVTFHIGTMEDVTDVFVHLELIEPRDLSHPEDAPGACELEMFDEGDFYGKGLYCTDVGTGSAELVLPECPSNWSMSVGGSYEMQGGTASVSVTDLANNVLFQDSLVGSDWFFEEVQGSAARLSLIFSGMQGTVEIGLLCSDFGGFGDFDDCDDTDISIEPLLPGENGPISFAPCGTAWFTFTLTQTTTMELYTLGDEWDDPVMTILDGNGDFVEENDDCFDASSPAYTTDLHSCLTTTLTPGDYIVEITGYGDEPLTDTYLYWV